ILYFFMAIQQIPNTTASAIKVVTEAPKYLICLIKNKFNAKSTIAPTAVAINVIFSFFLIKKTLLVIHVDNAEKMTATENTCKDEYADKYSLPDISSIKSLHKTFKRIVQGIKSIIIPLVTLSNNSQ